MNQVEAKARLRTAADRAKATVANPNLSSAQKKTVLDKLDNEIAECKTALDASAYASRMMVGGSSIDSTEDSDVATGKGIVGRAPSLVLDPEQQTALFKSVRDRMPFVTKALVDSSSVDPASYPAQHLPPLLAAREPNRIADLMPTIPTSASVNEYYVTTGTAAAAPTAEGAPKPESGILFRKAQAVATKIAHWMQVSEEAMSDFAPFSQLLAQDMIAGVIDAENRELLQGIGTTTASRFKGLLVVSGTQSYVRLVADSVLDALEIAGSQLRSAGRFVTPDAVVMHPLDFSVARRTKSTYGTYVAGDPTQDGPATLWGTRVVLTSEIPQGTAIVPNFAQSCQLFVREGLSVRSNAFGSGFRSNEVEVIAELRESLAVVAPAAISVVTVSTHA